MFAHVVRGVRSRMCVCTCAYVYHCGAAWPVLVHEYVRMLWMLALTEDCKVILLRALFLLFTFVFFLNTSYVFPLALVLFSYNFFFFGCIAQNARGGHGPHSAGDRWLA